LPGTHTNEDTQGKQEQESTSHHELAEPQPSTEELSQTASSAAEKKDNRGDYHCRQGYQAHDTQHHPHEQLPDGQDKTIDLGTHKVGGVCSQFLELL
jgi:hypothetical protein